MEAQSFCETSCGEIKRRKSRRKKSIEATAVTDYFLPLRSASVIIAVGCSLNLF